MSFHVIQPPGDETKLAEVGREIFDAASTLGLNMDLHGFLAAWVSGVRVLAERDQGRIVTLCLMALGRRWTDQLYNASILELRGDNPEPMLEFAKQIASAMGADTLFQQTTEPFPPITDGKIIHTVTQYMLQ